MIKISPLPLHHNPNPNPNPCEIRIPLTQTQISTSFIKTASFIFLLLSLLVFVFINSLQSLSISASLNQEQTTQEKEAMKVQVHPLPKKRNSISIQYYIANNGSNGNGNNNGNNGNPFSVGSHKKLRRLPHIFSRVLELPFRSDADVSVEENPDCFRFVAETENIGEVRAQMIEIHPGVTKIVVRPNGFLGISSLDELELDMWRFRLPESTRPELASAVFSGGELIVTVPKGEEVEGEGNVGDGEFRGGMGNNNDNNNNARLVLVQ